jgi:DNA-binding MarR family transcriptional regulator
LFIFPKMETKMTNSIAAKPAQSAVKPVQPAGISNAVSPAASDNARAISDGEAQVSRVADRYGDAGRAGWSPLPDVLLFNQHKLGLGSEDLNVLLNMMAHYYSPGAMPFVRPNVIAKRMGVSTRSVQRSITRLRNKNLILKAKGPKRQVIHDLQPLLDKLQPLARDRIADKGARQALAEHQRAFEEMMQKGA